MSGKRRGLGLPREHGAWVMLFSSLLLGVLAAWPVRASVAALLLILLAGAFVAQEGLRRLPARPPENPAVTWGAAAAALLSGCALWRRPGGEGLLVLAAAAGGVMLLQMLAPPRWRMGPWVQLAGVAGLTLGAPAAVVAARGVLGRPAWWLWAACVLFFAGAVANVHLVIGAPRATPAELARAGRRHLATLAANLALVVVLVQQGRGGHPALLAAAYGPVVVRALAGRRWAVSQPPLKRVGWWETAWALWFVAWTAGWART